MAAINDKRTITGWAFYDWANSVYPLVITSSIFPIYYISVTTKGGSDLVSMFGFSFKNSALYAYALSAAYLVISLVSPILSGIADAGSNKKLFMKFFCYLGSLCCSLLYFFDADSLGVGILAFMGATIGFSGSIVFYNAFLPEIATPDKQDHVSAKGFAMGYMGSSLLLIFNLLMIMKPEMFGIDDPSFPAKFSFLLTGLWWAGFAQITFARLPENRKAGKLNLTKGYGELRKVWRELQSLPALRRFLWAFFFYNMGVQTVMYAATIFGDKELKLQSGELITTILIIQFVAIGGAYLFSWLSAKTGNLPAIMMAITVWIGVCAVAYGVTGATGFYVLAFVVGMVMGGIQSLSRSTYSKMLPETTDHASYFSFYDVCEKTGLVIGTAMYGMVEEITGSMRNSIFALMVFFIIGLFMLMMLQKSEKVQLQ